MARSSQVPRVLLVGALVAGAGVAVLPGASASSHPVGLGTAGSYAVLGGQSVSNTGPSVLNGDLGVSPGTALTGFGGAPNGTVNGATHAADAEALGAQTDLTTAYNEAAGRATSATLTGQDLGAGRTLLPGVYTFATSAQLTGALTLDAQGDPAAVFIFQIGSTLITAPNSSVTPINGAQACNVYWQVGSSATLDTSTAFVGNVMALTSISALSGTMVNGRLLARNGSVSLINNVITRATCATDTTTTTAAPTTTTTTAAPTTTTTGALTTSAPTTVPGVTASSTTGGSTGTSTGTGTGTSTGTGMGTGTGTGTSTGLARTGLSSLLKVMVGLSLVLVGTALRIAARRPRQG